MSAHRILITRRSRERKEDLSLIRAFVGYVKSYG